MIGHRMHVAVAYLSFLSSLFSLPLQANDCEDHSSGIRTLPLNSLEEAKQALSPNGQGFATFDFRHLIDDGLKKAIFDRYDGDEKKYMNTVGRSARRERGHSIDPLLRPIAGQVEDYLRKSLLSYEDIDFKNVVVFVGGTLMDWFHFDESYITFIVFFDSYTTEIGLLMSSHLGEINGKFCQLSLKPFGLPEWVMVSPLTVKKEPNEYLVSSQLIIRVLIICWYLRVDLPLLLA